MLYLSLKKAMAIDLLLFNSQSILSTIKFNASFVYLPFLNPYCSFDIMLHFVTEFNSLLCKIFCNIFAKLEISEICL